MPACTKSATERHCGLEFDTKLPIYAAALCGGSVLPDLSNHWVNARPSRFWWVSWVHGNVVKGRYPPAVRLPHQNLLQPRV